MADSRMHMGIEITSWINIAAGIAIAAVPFFVDGETTMQLWATVLAGLAIVALSGFDAWAAATGRARNALWPSVANVVVAAALAAYVWYTGASGWFLYVTAGAGALVVLLGLYDVYGSMQEPASRRVA